MEGGSARQARLAETLAAHRTEALFYRKLATLIDTVPIAGSLEDLRFSGVPRERFAAWCTSTAAQRLAVMPQRWDPISA